MIGTVTVPDTALRAVLGRVDDRLELAGSWPLLGGISARVTAVEATAPDGTVRRLVIREYGARDLAADPHIAVHEHDVLGRLRAAGLLVPRPLLADESVAALPGPYLVIEYIDGQAMIDPACSDVPAAAVISQLATELARIHDARVSTAELPFLVDMTTQASARVADRPAVLDEPLSEPAVRAVLERIWPPPAAPSHVLHGDYWPGNTLWRDGSLVSVIDWENVAAGDPMADLGNARMEICIAYGPDGAADFTRQYCTLRPAADVGSLRHWDFYAALRHAGRMSGWGLPDAELARLRSGHQQFVAMITADG